VFCTPTKIISLALACLLLIANADARGVVTQRRRGGRRAATASKMRSAQTGTWGGEHISLEVTDGGGTVEYDCAHGTIDRKIVLDARGRFHVSGTHVREHGGPVRRDEQPDSHPAQYTGQIVGDQMTLTVAEVDTGYVVGVFKLTRGQQPRLMKCR
jgi:hypothetical protein